MISGLVMEREFWLERWERNQIGFHRATTNPLLQKFWPEAGVTKGSGVFVPLCGKSLDMRYLAGLGHPVVGVELSRTAIEAYFEEAGQPYELLDWFYGDCFKGSDTTVFCGDFFDISIADILGVRGVFDRGALVALPPGLRARYADHLQRIVPEHAHILLITLEYDQSKVDGPPFSVDRKEVELLFGARGRVEQLATIVSREVPPHFAAAGIQEVTEAVYRITKDH